MIGLYRTVGMKFPLMSIALIAATAANASMLDCAGSVDEGLVASAGCAVPEIPANRDEPYGAEEPDPTGPVAPVSDLKSDQTHASSAVPLLLLMSVLITVVLIRAKSCNTK